MPFSQILHYPNTSAITSMHHRLMEVSASRMTPIGIDWKIPTDNSLLSEKDMTHELLKVKG